MAAAIAITITVAAVVVIMAPPAIAVVVGIPRLFVVIIVTATAVNGTISRGSHSARPGAAAAAVLCHLDAHSAPSDVLTIAPVHGILRVPLVLEGHESESRRITSHPDVGHLAITGAHVLKLLLGHARLQVAKVGAAAPRHSQSDVGYCAPEYTVY